MNNAEVKSLAGQAQVGRGSPSGKAAVDHQPRLRLASSLKSAEVFLFLGAIALAMLIGAVYVSVLPKIYEARSAFQLTTDPKAEEALQGLLPTAEEVERALLVKYDIVNRSSREVLYPRISGIWRLGDAIFVSAESKTGEEASTFLRKEIAEYLQGMQRTYQAAVTAQERLVDRLKVDEQELSRRISLLAPEDPRLASQNPALVLLAGVEKSKLFDQLIKVREQLEKMTALHLKLRGKAISLLRDAVLTNGGAPIRPRLSVILGVAAALGAMLASSLIFLRRIYFR
jgi:hypothetical protein